MGSDWLEEEWVYHQYQCLVSWDSQIKEGNLKKIRVEQEDLLTLMEQLEEHLEDHLHHHHHRLLQNQREVLLEDLANLLLEEEDQRLEKEQEETVPRFLLPDMNQEILLTQQLIH